MASDGSPFLFEQEWIRGITGETIRPGGLSLTDRAMAFCDLAEGSRVLDVGCGIGASITHLKSEYGLEAIGLDPSASFLREGRERHPGTAFIRGIAESLPFAAQALTAVLCECVLSLMTQPRLAWEEFERVLVPEGFVIITDMVLRGEGGLRDLSNMPVRSCVGGALAKSAMDSMAHESGFRIVLWEDHTSLLKAFVVQSIFACGSMGEFLAQSGLKEDRCLMKEARPGYCLLIAKKGTL